MVFAGSALKWEEYLRRAGMLQGKISIRRWMSSSNVITDQTYEYKRNAGGKRLQFTDGQNEEGKKTYQETNGTDFSFNS